MSAAVLATSTLGPRARFARSPSAPHQVAGAPHSTLVAQSKPSAATKPPTLHPFAAKLPSPKKTGNHSLDEDQGAKIRMLRELISDCPQDLSAVPPLFTILMERRRAADTPSDDVEFKGVKNLRNLDPDFVVSFLANKSDLTVGEIVTATGHDAEVPFQLLCFASQLPMGLKWAMALFSKEVTYRFLSLRVVDVGDRLAGFKGKGGSQRGRIDWTVGCFTPIFGESGRMERVKHWSGDDIIVPDGLIIMKATSSITENWHDMSAAILQPFVPPVRLCQLFQSAGTGPWKYIVIQEKSADLDRMLNANIETYEDEKRRITSAASSTNASDKLKAMQQVFTPWTGSRCEGACRCFSSRRGKH